MENRMIEVMTFTGENYEKTERKAVEAAIFTWEGMEFGIHVGIADDSQDMFQITHVKTGMRVKKNSLEFGLEYKGFLDIIPKVFEATIPVLDARSRVLYQMGFKEFMLRAESDSEFSRARAEQNRLR